MYIMVGFNLYLIVKYIFFYVFFFVFVLDGYICLISRKRIHKGFESNRKKKFKKVFKGGIFCKRKRNHFDRKVSKNWVVRRNEIREEGKKKKSDNLKLTCFLRIYSYWLSLEGWKGPYIGSC